MGHQCGGKERARSFCPRRVGAGRSRLRRECCLQPPVSLLPAGLGKLVRPRERLPTQRVGGTLKPVNRLHVLEETVEVVRMREDGVLGGIPYEQVPRRHEREHVLPVERDAGHVRQIEAKLGNERRQVRPALRVGIASECSKAATGHGG